MEKQVRKSKPRVDLTNKKFGYLTPLSYIKGGKWLCRCDCGNEVEVDTRNLNSNHTTSCGCKIYESKNVYDMLSYENDNLKVLSREGSDNQQVALWNCLCKHCGNIFTTRGSSIRAGQIKSCGCVHSHNEKNITNLFIENGIEFATQYTFPNLKGKERTLRFDFAVFKHGQLSHLIEYNGKQHYTKIDGSWGDNFETNQLYDSLKKEYCLKNNIRLVIIKYDQDYTIEDLI